jgi:hypothetical protein
MHVREKAKKQTHLEMTLEATDFTLVPAALIASTVQV